MRINYFGKNKENGTGRFAVISFTDNECDLYDFIANYENTYGNESRKFNGRVFVDERDENGVAINKAYIDVDDFDDFINFKANYKEAKKEFKSLKKQTSESEETSVPEVGEFVYDVVIHNFYGCDTYTVRADGWESAKDKALKIIKNESLDDDYYSIDSIRIYEENSDELLKEIIFEPTVADATNPDEINNKKSEINSMYGITANSPDIYNEYNETKELLADDQFHRLTKTLIKSLFKAIGIQDTRKISFTIANDIVFFNYKGKQYKYYPSQCKIFKKCGRKYQRINWKDFAEENISDGQKQNRGRSPPFTPDIRSINIDKFKIKE